MLYYFNYIPHKNYNNNYFNIKTYISNIDKDNDGIDDQTDILDGAKKYISTKPKYKSKYYNTGYPNDGYGVCSDVVAFALKDAGYDLQILVNEHILANKDIYPEKLLEMLEMQKTLNQNILEEYKRKEEANIQNELS